MEQGIFSQCVTALRLYYILFTLPLYKKKMQLHLLYDKSFPCQQSTSDSRKPRLVQSQDKSRFCFWQIILQFKKQTNKQKTEQTPHPTPPENPNTHAHT